MDRDFATKLIDEELSALRKLSYAECQLRMGHVATKSISGPDGTEYHIDIEAFWDAKKNENIRVLVLVNGGGLSDFVPISGSFIISPDGAFVGEDSN